MRVLVSALLPSNRSISSGNPPAVVSSPTVTCGSTPMFLAHPDLAQLVLTLDLEVQGRNVVEHDRQGPGPGGAHVAGPGDNGPVVPLGHALEAAHERHPVRGSDTEVSQDPDGVQLAAPARSPERAPGRRNASSPRRSSPRSA